MTLTEAHALPPASDHDSYAEDTRTHANRCPTTTTTPNVRTNQYANTHAQARTSGSASQEPSGAPDRTHRTLMMEPDGDARMTLMLESDTDDSSHTLTLMMEPNSQPRTHIVTHIHFSETRAETRSQGCRGAPQIKSQTPDAARDLMCYVTLLPLKIARC